MPRAELHAWTRALPVLLALLATSPAATAVVLTGEVQAVDAQPILVPQSNSSPVVLRYFVAEGARVEKGDIVLRIDPGNSAGQVRDLEAQIEQARAKMAKEVAELRVKAVEAELALVDAEAALATAKVDATIPEGLVSGLDYDRYQGELDHAAREQSLMRKQLETARAAVARRQKDGELEIDKLIVQRDYHAARIRSSEVRAERDGVVVHGFSNWRGDDGRIDEGSSAFPGSKAGEVVSGGAMQVRAWALEPDRRGLTVGQPVRLSFDALPGRHATGRISMIAGAPEAKPEWSAGHYFTIDIELGDIARNEQGKLPLLPGMSVRVDIADAAATATAEPAAAKKSAAGAAP